MMLPPMMPMMGMPPGMPMPFVMPGMPGLHGMPPMPHGMPGMHLPGLIYFFLKIFYFFYDLLAAISELHILICFSLTVCWNFVFVKYSIMCLFGERLI